MGIRDPKGIIHQWEVEAGMGQQLTHPSAPWLPSPSSALPVPPGARHHPPGWMPALSVDL